jgi:hypothetical protein
MEGEGKAPRVRNLPLHTLPGRHPLDTDPAMTTPAYTEASTTRFANVSVDGTAYRIHYNEIGSGERVVVMLHGSGPGATGWANFNRNIDPFVAAGYRVLLIDCPGWGKAIRSCARGRAPTSMPVQSGVCSTNSASTRSIWSAIRWAGTARWPLRSPIRRAWASSC